MAQHNSNFLNLKIIALGLNLIGDQTLKALAENGFKFPNLKEFYLYNNQIADDGFRVFV